MIITANAVSADGREGALYTSRERGLGDGCVCFPLAYAKGLPAEAASLLGLHLVLVV